MPGITLGDWLEKLCNWSSQIARKKATRKQLKKECDDDDGDQEFNKILSMSGLLSPNTKLWLISLLLRFFRFLQVEEQKCESSMSVGLLYTTWGHVKRSFFGSHGLCDEWFRSYRNSWAKSWNEWWILTSFGLRTFLWLQTWIFKKINIILITHIIIIKLCKITCNLIDFKIVSN